MKLFDFLSSYNFNLLEEINAISMPEKKAESKRVIIIKVKCISCGKVKKKSSKQTIIAVIDVDITSYISNFIGRKIRGRLKSFPKNYFCFYKTGISFYCQYANWQQHCISSLWIANGRIP